MLVDNALDISVGDSRPMDIGKDPMVIAIEGKDRDTEKGETKASSIEVEASGLENQLEDLTNAVQKSEQQTSSPNTIAIDTVIENGGADDFGGDSDVTRWKNDLHGTNSSRS